MTPAAVARVADARRRWSELAWTNALLAVSETDGSGCRGGPAVGPDVHRQGHLRHRRTRLDRGLAAAGRSRAGPRCCPGASAEGCRRDHVRQGQLRRVRQRHRHRDPDRRPGAASLRPDRLARRFQRGRRRRGGRWHRRLRHRRGLRRVGPLARPVRRGIRSADQRRTGPADRPDAQRRSVAEAPVRRTARRHAACSARVEVPGVFARDPA